MAHVSSSQSKPRRVYIAKWDFRNPFRVRTVFCWCFQSNRCLHVCCNMRSRSRSRSLLPEDAGSMWTTEEASKKLAVALQDKTGDDEEETNEKPQWQTAFKEGVDFDETNLKEYLKKPEYDTRHDLNFLTPAGRTVRCKVR